MWATRQQDKKNTQAQNPKPSVTVVITHGSYLGTTVADHAGLVLNGNNDQIIYDPGGAYQQDEKPQSGTGGIMSASDDGARYGDYINYETKNESYVTAYKVEISSADAAKIENKLMNGSVDNTPFRCAADVSNVLQGVGPFKNLPSASTPGSLEKNVSKMDLAGKSWFRGTDH